MIPTLAECESEFDEVEDGVVRKEDDRDANENEERSPAKVREDVQHSGCVETTSGIPHCNKRNLQIQLMRIEVSKRFLGRKVHNWFQSIK